MEVSEGGQGLVGVKIGAGGSKVTALVYLLCCVAKRTSLPKNSGRLILYEALQFPFDISLYQTLHILIESIHSIRLSRSCAIVVTFAIGLYVIGTDIPALSFQFRCFDS